MPGLIGSSSLEQRILQNHPTRLMCRHLLQGRATSKIGELRPSIDLHDIECLTDDYGKQQSFYSHLLGWMATQGQEA